jgi:hypothetical protein
MVGRLLQSVFFGQLRPIEVEVMWANVTYYLACCELYTHNTCHQHLYERSWYAVTETCLAMTIFRDEFDIQFVIVFTTLLFLKIFHWLCQDRVEYVSINSIMFWRFLLNLQRHFSNV